jgi:hypothetical protein
MALGLFVKNDTHRVKIIAYEICPGCTDVQANSKPAPMSIVVSADVFTKRSSITDQLVMIEERRTHERQG